MASVASTYARAFADVVFSAHLDAARAVGGLRQIAALLTQSADLRRVWENPAVPAEQKRKLLDAIVQRDGIDRPVRNLIAVLIDHRRLNFLPRIVEQFEKELGPLAWDSPMRRFPAPVNWVTPKSTRLEAQIAKVDRKESPRAIRLGPVFARRRSSSHRQHDL